MLLIQESSPHTGAQGSTARMMGTVAAATLPGLVAMVHFFGWGVAFNVAWAVAVALATEALVLRLRGRPIRTQLLDGSALVTGTLLGLAVPPTSPWWMVGIGAAFSIGIAKHLYGGLGQNPFNPAMVGYVVLLISFPLEMSGWLPAHTQAPSPLDALATQWLPGNLDGITAATALDALKHNSGLTATELYAQHPSFGAWGGSGWEWVNGAFLLGGLVLLYLRVIDWRLPAGMLFGLAAMALLFWGGSGSDTRGAPLMHLTSGGTMLAAFFIVTDPVTASTTPLGRLVYSTGVGVLAYVIRAWGGYPDGIAFAVLLMNFAAPLIDHYTPPRTYGHPGAGAGQGRP